MKGKSFMRDIGRKTITSFSTIIGGTKTKRTGIMIGTEAGVINEDQVALQSME
jgi:hypothetical protein